MFHVHIKNNHHRIDTFPNTAEGEEVFTITRERFDTVASAHPEVAAQTKVSIDWDTDNFDHYMATADVLVTWDLPTENLAKVAPRLKWIHIIGAGVEHLTPMDWLPPGVTLTNNKGVHADKGGEFGIMSILMLHNHLPRIITHQNHARYDSLYSTPIKGKTLVLIGTGSIGRAVAKHAQALGIHVIGVSRHGKPLPELDEAVAVSELDRVLPRGDFVFVVTPLTQETTNLLSANRLALMKPGAGLVNIGRAAVVDYDALVEGLNSGGELDRVLPRGDFVFVVTPLTQETTNLLSANRLALMKPGAGLVNIGRAAVVDYDALVEGLNSGAIGGAVLDVFDPEPLPPESNLWSQPNLVITPHVSADDGNAYVPLTLDVFFNNMRRLINGEALENQVNTTLGY